MPANPARRRLAVAGLTALALGSAVTGAVLGAGQSDEADNAPLSEPGRAKPRESVSFLARIVPPAAPAANERDPAVPRSIMERARQLPLERQVAQLFVFGFEGTDAGADIFPRLRRLDVGGILIGPGSYADPAQLDALAGEATAVARRGDHLPPFVLASQQGGDLNSLPDLPPSQAPADTPSASAAAAGALDSARALRDLNVTGVLGPVLDVGLESGSPLGARVYSDDPEELVAFAEATVDSYRRARVFSSAAHFPGLGAADQSTEEGPATVGLDLAELRERDLIPFEAAIDAGVPGVTLAHALYPVGDFTVPASLSRRIATGLLRDELGFEGVALTDDLADPAITTLYTVPDAAVEAVRAGADMLLVSGPAGDQQAAYVAVLRAARSARIPRARLERAVGRILVAKRNYGLTR
ncbi:MAG: glycoside hydrolase family 3 N-terminal domain-containing protein [Thermoleophilaceae bacterium]